MRRIKTGTYPQAEQRHAEELEVLAGRRGNPAQRAVRLSELQDLFNRFGSVRKELRSTTVSVDAVRDALGTPAEPASVLGRLDTVESAADTAAQAANAAGQTASQVSQNLTTLTAGFTGSLKDAFAASEERVDGNMSHVHGLVPGYAVIFNDLAKLHGAPAGSALTGRPELGYTDTTTVTDQGAVRASGGIPNGDLVLAVPPVFADLLSGNQIKVSVLVRAVEDDNSATDFALAYSTNGSGDSGIMTAGLTDTWRWVNFIYDVPAGPTAVNHYISVWSGFTTGSSQAFKIGAVSVQLASAALALPIVADMRASVNKIAGLDLTDNTAFAAMLNQLSVNASGRIAGIDNFGSAMADIHGKAQAAYLLRAKAGGNAAQFEMVAWDNVDGGGSAITMDADTILAKGTLSADRFVSGATANLLHDPIFVHGSTGWELSADDSSGAVYTETTIGLRMSGDSYAGTTYPTFMMQQEGTETVGAAVLQIKHPVNATLMNIPCKPGDWLDFSAYAYGLRCAFKVEILFINEGGGVASAVEVVPRGTATDGGTDNPDLWKRVWGKAQAPAGAFYATVQITKYGTTSDANSFLFIHKPMVSPTHADATKPGIWTPGGSTMINGGNILTDTIGREQLRVKSIYAEHLNSKEVKAEFVDVDGTLDMDADDSALRMDKLSATDYANDGAYFGRHLDNQGNKSFSFFIGRKTADAEQYIRMTKEDGLVIKNAEYVIGSGLTEVSAVYANNTVSLAGKDSFTLQAVGGGGGGSSGTLPGSSWSVPGDNGTTTYVQLFDGPTLINTWTAAGGWGGSGHSGQRVGRQSALTGYGTGGLGGLKATVTHTHTSGDGDTHYTHAYGNDGNGGYAGSLLNIGLYDISGLTNPYLVIAIGQGGAGGNHPNAGNGVAGTAGVVYYQTHTNIFVPAAPIALNVTASGTFAPGYGTPISVSFPVIAQQRGLWTIFGGPGWLQIQPGGGGHWYVMNNTAPFSFVSNGTPIVRGSSANTTVYYNFRAM